MSSFVYNAAAYAKKCAEYHKTKIAEKMLAAQIAAIPNPEFEVPFNTVDEYRLLHALGEENSFTAVTAVRTDKKSGETYEVMVFKV